MSSRTGRAANDRAKALARARRRAGLTQQELDRQYREALARNPQANPYARRDKDTTTS